MHYYKLEDKIQDDLFLRGESLHCKAVLTREDISSGLSEPGTRIIVKLSNGAKYMGRVVRFHTNVSQTANAGMLEIVRDKKP